MKLNRTAIQAQLEVTDLQILINDIFTGTTDELWTYFADISAVEQLNCMQFIC